MNNNNKGIKCTKKKKQRKKRNCQQYSTAHILCEMSVNQKNNRKTFK